LCSKKHFGAVKALGVVEAFDYSAPGVGARIREYTQNSLRYAWDTWGKPESSQICADALSTDSPCIYGSVLPTKSPRSDVTSISTNMYTMFGESFTIKGMEFPQALEDLEFAKKFMALTESLLADRRLKTHVEEVRPDGLQGVLDGLTKLKSGTVSGKKLVYRVAETP
jgi:NADPH:quinone reductase-like Zn-dependent oxidoreductase